MSKRNTWRTEKSYPEAVKRISGSFKIIKASKTGEIEIKIIGDLLARAMVNSLEDDDFKVSLLTKSS